MSTWTTESKSVLSQDSLLLEDLSYLLTEGNDKLALDQSSVGGGWASIAGSSSSWSTTTKETKTWTSLSAQVGSWTSQSKIGIDDLLALENATDILGTENSDSIGLEQSDSTGVAWSGTNKT